MIIDQAKTRQGHQRRGVASREAEIARRLPELARQIINSDGIDIFIDLKGFTEGMRTSILALRPAPIQVNYLGYPGTLGPGLCDYIVTDEFCTPQNSAFALATDTASLEGAPPSA
ncbi:MAG: hypothetical protein ACR650_12720 [Methylocystis sp.]